MQCTITSKLMDVPASQGA